MPSKATTKNQASIENWIKLPKGKAAMADKEDVVTDDDGEGRTLPPPSEPDSDMESNHGTSKNSKKSKKATALDLDDEMEDDDVPPVSSTTKANKKLIMVKESSGKTSKARKSSASAKVTKPPKKKPAAKPKAKAKKPKDGSAEESEAESDNEEEEEQEESDEGGDRLNKAKAHVDDLKLPPLTTMPAIFKDIVARNPKLKDVADLFRNHPDESGEPRKLRVGTMCSGTESPLLALQLISEAMEADGTMAGRTLDIEHIFSCEIEPFKQAYIERNFKPPVLFRDVTELGGEEAYVAHLHYSFLTHYY